MPAGRELFLFSTMWRFCLAQWVFLKGQTAIRKTRIDVWRCVVLGWVRTYHCHFVSDDIPFILSGYIKDVLTCAEHGKPLFVQSLKRHKLIPDSRMTTNSNFDFRYAKILIFQGSVVQRRHREAPQHLSEALLNVKTVRTANGKQHF